MARRVDSWNVLWSLNNIPNMPRPCVGDFNEILAVDEVMGLNPLPTWQIKNFIQVIDEYGL